MSLSIHPWSSRITSAILLCLVVLNISFTLTGLRGSEHDLHIVADVDLRGVSLAGDLAFQIEESRRRLLCVIAAADSSTRARLAADIQAPDIEASIVMAHLQALRLPGKVNGELANFNRIWQQYEDLRDTVVLLALQGREAEALAIENNQGAPLFDNVLSILSSVKQRLAEAARAETASVRAAQSSRERRVVISGLCSLLSALGLLYIANSRQHMRASLQRAENLARKQQQWLESAQKLRNLGFYTSGRNPDFFQASPQDLALLGFAPTATLTRADFVEMVLPEDRGNLVQMDGPALQDYEAEYRILRLDGEIRWLLARATVERNEARTSWQMTGAHIDITDRKRHEQDLQTAKERADAGMRAKNAFLATMSHELRTPLNGVLGMAGILAETRLDTLQRECVDTINQSGNLLNSLINDILEISNLESEQISLTPSVFDPADLLRGSADTFGPSAAEKGLSLQVSLTGLLPDKILADRQRLEQVLRHLIDNAIKFTSQGGISLRASAVSGSPHLAMLRFEVIDTGIGIAPGLQSSLFDRFTQADSSNSRKYGGIGVGLAIARRIVQQMDGVISFHSQPGAGTTFYFDIPVSVIGEGKPLHELEPAALPA